MVGGLFEGSFMSFHKVSGCFWFPGSGQKSIFICCRNVVSGVILKGLKKISDTGRIHWEGFPKSGYRQEGLHMTVAGGIIMKD